MSVEWENSEAKKELAFLVNLFGQPTAIGKQKGGVAIWNAATLHDTKLFGLPNCLDEYEVRDEAVLQKFPEEHHANQYASIVVDVDPETFQYLANLSGSIQYDPIKHLLTARGGNIITNIGTLYLALRVIENPARLRSIQKNGMYGRLLRSMHKADGVRGMNLNQTERVYKGLCRMKRDLPQAPMKGYWRGAFSEDGGPPMVGGRYLGNALNSTHAAHLEQKRADAESRRMARAKQARERRMSREDRDVEENENVLQENIWAGNSQDLRNYNSGNGNARDGNAREMRRPNSQNAVQRQYEEKRLAKNAQNVRNSGRTEAGIYYPSDDFKQKYDLADDVQFKVSASEANMTEEQIAARLDEAYALEDGALQNSVPDFDIDLDLEQQYEREYNRNVEIRSIEPMQGRFHSDIDLDLSKLYRTSYNREARVTNIEPMQAHNTTNWALQLATAEGTNVANSGRAGSHNRSNAKEHFCGRRQYNPDIPPCRAHEDYPENRGCDPCDNYVKVYHTGLRPAETTDPTCYYGRRHDPYVDAAAYMRHYEDNAHDPKFYDNFY